MSQAAQEAKLDRELLRFEEELELFLADKDTFLEDLYRRLKQVTSLCKSWRCQRLRDVIVTHLVSTRQVNTFKQNFFATTDANFQVLLAKYRYAYL